MMWALKVTRRTMATTRQGREDGAPFAERQVGADGDGGSFYSFGHRQRHDRILDGRHRSHPPGRGAPCSVPAQRVQTARRLVEAITVAIEELGLPGSAQASAAPETSATTTASTATKAAHTRRFAQSRPVRRFAAPTKASSV
jgi:hypothetical protein